jgi:hypothetical protein
MAGCDRTKHIGNLKPRWIGTHHQQDPGTRDLPARIRTA